MNHYLIHGERKVTLTLYITSHNANNTKSQEVKIVKKPLITILIILFAVMNCLNFVSAENETEILTGRNAEEEVLASEDGHLNISFDNGYNGYCINYGEHEAKTGYEYRVKNTSYATNKNSGDDVGNCLKVYFVDYYEDAMRNDIVTQHTIWHFTDDFNGWRIDPTLIENIKSTASTKIIPDSGAVRQINNTTEAVFDFCVLSSDKFDHQNFFAYKITYREIAKNIIGNTTSSNITSNESEKNIANSTENNTSNLKEKNITKSGENSTINEKQKTVVKSSETDRKITEEKTQKVSKSVNLSKHTTGKRSIGILMLLILLGIVAIKYIRRD